MEYKCPNCQTQLQWDSNNEFRPFCSERCKNNDLIKWATGENALPGIELDSDLFDSLSDAED